MVVGVLRRGRRPAWEGRGLPSLAVAGFDLRPREGWTKAQMMLPLLVHVLEGARAVVVGGGSEEEQQEGRREARCC